MISKDKIIEKLYNIRDRLEDKYGMVQGRAEDACDEIELFLLDNSIEYDIINGWCQYDDYNSYYAKNYAEHMWIEATINNELYYIDITADQFNEMMHPSHEFDKVIFSTEIPECMSYEEPKGENDIEDDLDRLENNEENDYDD